MLVFSLSLGVYSARRRKVACPKRQAGSIPKFSSGILLTLSRKPARKWRVRWKPMRFSTVWSDGADYDGELCIFFPEIEGISKAAYGLVLRMYFMQGSQGGTSASPLHCAWMRRFTHFAGAHGIVRKWQTRGGSRACRWANMPRRCFPALPKGGYFLRLIGERIYTQSLDAGEQPRTR